MKLLITAILAVFLVVIILAGFLVACDQDIEEVEDDFSVTQLRIDIVLKEEIDNGMEVRAYVKKNDVFIIPIAKELYDLGVKNIWYTNFYYENHGGTIGGLVLELQDSIRDAVIKHHLQYTKKIVDGKTFNLIGERYLGYCLDCDLVK